MPQMAPINWLSLFFIMCLTFMVFNLLNYFSYNINYSNNNYSNNIINKNKMDWKW